MSSATMTNEEVLTELQDMKTKVYLPSSFAEVASRFAELVTHNLNDDTRDAFFAVLEAGSKNVGKEEFAYMSTKKMFVTSYHSKAKFHAEQQTQIREWGLQAAQLPYT
eukprot:TRINITY_DN46062_c0_g1_i1.p1 TRINITY_DN46062_c0_g1~~TRINITY_DN46062_c0_g1_i1.p1  ORF type:complete len:108 (-),score=35.17 TRINITY_DN46062_c0_g1_i1:399-722(-)